MHHPLILLIITALTTALPLLKPRAGTSINLGPLHGKVPDLIPVVAFPIAVWEAGEDRLQTVGKDLPVDPSGVLGAR